MARSFLIELHGRYQLNDVGFLVDSADHLGPDLVEAGYRFQDMQHEDWHGIEHIFFKRGYRTLCFSDNSDDVDIQTVKGWLENTRR